MCYMVFFSAAAVFLAINVSVQLSILVTFYYDMIKAMTKINLGRMEFIWLTYSGS